MFNGILLKKFKITKIIPDAIKLYNMKSLVGYLPGITKYFKFMSINPNFINLKLSISLLSNSKLNL
jgi:hypothetical protein